MKDAEHADHPPPLRVSTAPAAPNLRSITPVQTLLRLQQSAGNRAVCQLLSNRQTAAPAARLLGRTPVEFIEKVSEPQVGVREAIEWDAAFSVELSASECVVAIRAKITRDADVTAEQENGVRARAQSELARIWDRKFVVVYHSWMFDDEYLVRVKLTFVDSGQHLSIRLHKGHARGDLTNWYTSTETAHELGHQLGMLDEYVEITAANRTHPKAPGVFTDHSIMGNYRTEGAKKATAKLRHGTRLAEAITKAAGKPFTVRLASTPSPTPWAPGASPPQGKTPHK